MITNCRQHTRFDSLWDLLRFFSCYSYDEGICPKQTRCLTLLYFPWNNLPYAWHFFFTYFSNLKKVLSPLFVNYFFSPMLAISNVGNYSKWAGDILEKSKCSSRPLTDSCMQNVLWNSALPDSASEISSWIACIKVYRNEKRENHYKYKEYGISITAWNKVY